MILAKIVDRNDSTVMRINAFLGLNENPDGDTTLKNGEMAEMRNFRITQDRHMQIRPGYKTVLNLHSALSALDGRTTPSETETRVRGVWRGMAGTKMHIIEAYGGHIWDIDIEAETARDVGTATDADTHFFGFDEKVYMLNGHEYKVWDGGDGTEFEDVEGYVPLIQTATTPGGKGTMLEEVNRLTNKRRVEFSPDGTSTDFLLPETDIGAVYSVKDKGVEVTGYTVKADEGIVTFAAAPAQGTNTIEIGYTKGDGRMDEVTAMRFSELFNGTTDTRVFLYGDGSNKTIYSGIRYDTGRPSAEYFPDLYEAMVGESNTPITALVRHYSRMMAYKPNSAWVIQPSTLTLADSTVTAAYYVQPVNRQFGNEAMGQVKLLENNPLTLDVKSVYQWKSNSAYSGYISSNENNAKRISDRVAQTFRNMDLSRVKTFNIKTDHEFWFIYDGQAIVLNYSNDTWYIYAGLGFSAIIDDEPEKYGFLDDGRVVHFSRLYRSDDGKPIVCYAATGAMDFNHDWMTKYSPMIFVAMQPESNARIDVTVETNRRSDYPDKTVAYNLSTLLHVDFNHFSFATNRKPQVKRVKMKVKKATFYRLIFKSNSASATATLIETDVKLRYAGTVK